MSANLTVDNFEYSSDALAQAAYASSDSMNLSAFSEATIKTQGDYSLKGVASTSALDATLTKSFSIVNDLTNVKDLKFNIRSSRTGSNIKLGLYSGAAPTGGIITDDSYDTITSLAAHYKMNDNAASTTVVDTISGNNGTATANTNTLSVSGKINNSLSFNGSSNYIGIQYNLTRTAGTVSMWIKTSVKNQTLFTFSNSTYGFAGYQDREMSIDANGKIKFYIFATGGKTITGNTVVTDNNWHLIQGVYSASSGFMRIYIDGLLDKTDSLSINAADAMPYFALGSVQPGTVCAPANVFFNGYIDDVRIYSRALSIRDISALYSASNGTEDSSINIGTSKIHTFTSDGTFSTIQQLSADVLVVGGGGGGASGGGGAGGLIYQTGYSILSNKYSVTIGAGGVGRICSTTGGALSGGNGGNTTFSALVASGGGGGAQTGDTGNGSGLPGGSGGGGGAYSAGTTVGGQGTINQGTSGGGNGGFTASPYPAGGGGGATAAGGNATSNIAGGFGGLGANTMMAYNEVGVCGGGGGGVFYAGGIGGTASHGGGAGGGNTVGVSGTANTGGGGGGAGVGFLGGSGAGGLVIIKYPTALSQLVSEITPNITAADEWQSIRWNISNIADEYKSNINTLKITITNADAENTFYLDNLNVFPQTYDVVGVIE